MESVVATVTGYHGSDRFDLIKLIHRSGANFVGNMSNSITHLVCWRFEGKKYELAKKLKVKVVNHLWIEACIRKNRRVPEDLYTDKCGEEVGTLSLDISQFAEKESSQYNAKSCSKKQLIDTDSEDSAPIRWTNPTLSNEEEPDFALLPRERRKNTELGEFSHRRHMLVNNKMKKNGSSSSLNPDTKCTRRQIIDELSDDTTASDGPPSSDILANPKKRRDPVREREISRGGRRLVKKNATVDKPIFILDPEQEHNDVVILNERSDGTATHCSAIKHDREVGVREILEEIPEVTDVTNTVSHENQHVALSNSSLFSRELHEESLFPDGCSNQIEQGAPSSQLPDISCVICLAEFNLVRGLLLCGHRFCFQCIYDWARACQEKRKAPLPICPLCKLDFKTISKYTHKPDDPDQKVYTQTSLAEHVGTEVSVIDNQVPMFSDSFYPYDQLPAPPNALAGTVCCVCSRNEDEDFLECCNVCQRLCVHRYCLDPPLFPWTCDSCKDLQTFHRRRLIC